MKLQRKGLWLIAAGVLLSIGLLNVEQAFAFDRTCSLETLKGQYMVSASGTLFPPAFGVTTPSISAAAGYSIYDGNGTGTDYVTFTVNGVNQNVESGLQYLRCDRRRSTDRCDNGRRFRGYRVRFACEMVSLIPGPLSYSSHAAQETFTGRAADTQKRPPLAGWPFAIADSSFTAGTCPS